MADRRLAFLLGLEDGSPERLAIDTIPHARDGCGACHVALNCETNAVGVSCCT